MNWMIAYATALREQKTRQGRVKQDMAEVSRLAQIDPPGVT
jgi:hypothetical protein